MKLTEIEEEEKEFNQERMCELCEIFILGTCSLTDKFQCEGVQCDEAEELYIQELFNTPDVGVSFYITDKEESDDEIEEKYLKQITGAIEGEYEDNTYWYSELTYDNSSYDTTLRIGGHNLFDELSSFNGKWCLLKIKVK